MDFRILCFHGYQQTNETMKKRMKKILKEYKGIDFDFAESIEENMWYSLDNKLSKNNQIDKHQLNDEIIFNNIDVLNNDLSEKEYEMIDENFKRIDELLKIKKYDGFIGFSQGSIFARWYILSRQPNIKFFISIASYDAKHKIYSENKILFPDNIHYYNLYCKNDPYVLPELTKKLTQFNKGNNIECEGKHIIPELEIIKLLTNIYF